MVEQNKSLETRKMIKEWVASFLAIMGLMIVVITVVWFFFLQPSISDNHRQLIPTSKSSDPVPTPGPSVIKIGRAHV